MSINVRALKLIAGLGAALLVLALLAAWQLPPRLDWNRYRADIASFASARMGRQVHINGRVTLRLLPETVLVADGVSLADRGDGVSARTGALRLRIALAPLLRGRLVPRRLELDGPVVVLPWPLPRGATSAVSSRVAGGFIATVEGGSLRLGGFVLSAVSGAVRTDPDTGAFAAQGAARLGGEPCRFTALIGAPGQDGISTLTVTVDGQGPVLGAGGTLRGRLLQGGAVQGDLALRGPDLSRLLPGPALPWRLRGPVAAAEGTVRAPNLTLMLGASPGRGEATLYLGAAPHLAAAISLGQLPLDGWGWGALAASPWLPVQLDISAAASSWLGGTARNVQAKLALASGRGDVRAQAMLPGVASVQLNGTALASPHGESFDGTVNLVTADLPLLVAWLRPSAPALFGVLPVLPVTAAWTAQLHVQRGRASLSGIAGHIGASTIGGSLTFAAGDRPVVGAKLTLDKLALTAGQAGPGWHAGGLGAAASPFAAFDADMDIEAASATLGGLSLSHVIVQAQGGVPGLVLHRFAADLPGARTPAAHIEAGGTVAPDGALTDARLDFTAADVAALTPPWPLPADFWHGPLHLALTAAGPPQAVTGQMRGDLGDLRAEAEAHFDITAPSLAATVTLRHPGAPRLLAMLGVPGADSWIGAGSVAFLAHLALAPALLDVQDFSLGAGALRIAGRVKADFSGPEPGLSGRLEAPLLTLPSMQSGQDATLPLSWLGGWHGDVALAADQILVGMRPAASDASAALTVAGGAAFADAIKAETAGGRFDGQAAADTSQPLPVFLVRGALAGAAIDQLPALPSLALHDGRLDAGVDVIAAGHSQTALLATLSGEMWGAVHGTSVQGIDLPALTHVLTIHGGRLRPELAAALSTGESGPLSGGFAATLDHGALTIRDAAWAGPNGKVSVSGSIDLQAKAPDLRFRVRPAVPEPPALAVRIVGARRVVNVETIGQRKGRGTALKAKLAPEARTSIRRPHF